MFFSFMPEKAEEVFDNGVFLNLSRCDKPSYQLRALIDSATSDFPVQSVIGISPEDTYTLLDSVGIKNFDPNNGPKHVVFNIFGSEVQLFDSDKMIFTIAHRGDGDRVTFDGKELPTNVPGSTPYNKNNIFDDIDFIKLRKRKILNNPCVVKSDGSVHYTEAPKYPIGSVYTFSRGTRRYGSYLEDSIKEIISQKWDVLEPDPNVHFGDLAIQVAFFKYHNSKWGFAAGDVKRSHRISPDILLSKPREDGRRLAIEVDGPTHKNNFEDDHERNRCLSAAGWEVIRLRMCGISAIGPNDIIVPNPHKNLPEAQAKELLSKIEDFYKFVPEHSVTPEVNFAEDDFIVKNKTTEDTSIVKSKTTKDTCDKIKVTVKPSDLFEMNERAKALRQAKKDVSTKVMKKVEKNTSIKVVSNDPIVPSVDELDSLIIYVKSFIGGRAERRSRTLRFA